MEGKELEFILKQGEGQLIEFKESLNGIDKEMVAFANSEGGRIYEIKNIQREEIPEYPFTALREAIINAVMHRDYFEKGANVQIDIFDNRIQISNIGSLIPPLNKDNLGEVAVRRNPLIADLFHRIKFVEKIGFGLKRIKEECEKHSIGFEIEANGYFIAKFKLLENVDEKAGGNGEKTTQKILDLIKENSQITRKELAEKIGISENGIKFSLNQLKQKGLLKRIGADKGGHWGIIGDDRRKNGK